MSIAFEYPVLYLNSDDPEDADISYCEAYTWPIHFDRKPYEMTLEAQDYSFHLIFGSQINERFLCIPNWQFGCELAQRTNRSWNLDSNLKKAAGWTLSQTQSPDRMCRSFVSGFVFSPVSITPLTML